MSVMQVVRSTDGNHVYPVIITFYPGTITIEQFHLREKGRFRKETIHDSHAIKLVVSRNQTITRVFYGT